MIDVGELETPKMTEKVMSIEHTFELERKVSVPSLQDEGFSDVSHQAAWCAALLGLKYTDFKQHFWTGGDTFLNIYTECLKQGTELRRLYGEFSHGENFSSQNLLSQLGLKKHIFLMLTYTSGDRSNIHHLPQNLRTEFYERIDIEVHEFSALQSYKFCLISKNSYVFTVIPILGTHFIVLDPNAHSVGMLHKDNLDKYLKTQVTEDAGNEDSFLHVNVFCCA